MDSNGGASSPEILQGAAHGMCHHKFVTNRFSYDFKHILLWIQSDIKCVIWAILSKSHSA